MESISQSVITSPSIFTGKKYVDNKNEDFALDYVSKLNIVGLFFTASWCPPCQKFAEELVEVYNDCNLPAKEAGKDNIFEIIQVSCEKNEADFVETILEKPWINVPFNDNFNDYLITDYKISYMPVLLIITKERVVISENPRGDIAELGVKAHEKWIKTFKAQRERERELTNAHNN